MEENASQRLTCRVLRGTPYFMAKNDSFTHIICGGINFRYDMSKPSGERVVIDGFANGRPFQPDALYLVAVNNYLVGNEHCGLRPFSAEDALWSQLEVGNEGTIQDIIKEYIARETERVGGLSPEAINWKWSIIYSENPAAMSAYEGRTVAVLADRPQDGHDYVLYHEAQSCTLTDHSNSGGMDAAEIASCGDALVDVLPDDALIFTVHEAEEGLLMLTDPDGRYLTCGDSGGLSMTDTPADGLLSLWQLIEADGGYYIKSAAAGNNQALEYFGGRITTYPLAPSVLYLFNFYEVMADEAE